MANMLPTSTASLESTIRQGVNERLKDLHTAMPGVVVAFDSTTQLLTVQPAIRRNMRTQDGEQEILIPLDLPQLINVPIVLPQAGEFMVTVPVKPGDEVLLIFAERAIDSWYENGGVQNQSARRFHSLSDAFAIPGIRNKKTPITDYSQDSMELRNLAHTQYIKLLPASAIQIVSFSTIEIFASSGTTIAGELTVTGSVSLNGATVEHGGVNIGKTHTHAQGVDSDGDTQQNTGVPM